MYLRDHREYNDQIEEIIVKTMIIFLYQFADFRAFLFDENCLLEYFFYI
jgi:hypothetical protein